MTGLGALRQRLGLAADAPLLEWRRPAYYGRDDAEVGELLTDRTAAMLAVTINRGRRSADEHTGPATATVTLAGELLTGQPPAIGELVRLAIAPAVSTALGISRVNHYIARITGRITAALTDHQSGDWAVSITGPRAELDRRAYDPRYRTTVTMPAGSTDRNRADLLLQQTELGVAEEGLAQFGVSSLSDPEQFTVTALTLAPTDSAAQALDQLAGDTGSEILETRAGFFVWRTAGARAAAAAPAITLEAAHVLGPVSWTANAEAVFNQVQAAYGTGTPRAVELATDQQRGSWLAYAGRVLSLDGQLHDAADALKRAAQVLQERQLPAWTMPDLSAELTAEVLPTAQLRLLLSTLDHGTLLHVTGMPTPPGDPLPGPRVFVEGYTETITARSWRLQLAVTEAGLFRSARWSEVPAGLSWPAVPDLPIPGIDTSGAPVATTRLIWQAAGRWQPA